ncbi:MAG: hypothetical protein ACI9LX_003149 [Paraglaciecola sp.]|jgi:hypothetical protein
MTQCSSKIFVINLDVSVSRMRKSQSQLYDLERVNAVDGRKLRHDELAGHYDVDLIRQQSHCLLTFGE